MHGWVNGGRRALEYCMDPRNFLNSIRIFQFESLSFNANTNKKDGVEKILYGTEFYDKKVSYKDTNGTSYSMAENYSDLIMKAAVTSNVSAYHIASRIRQEVGPFISHSSINGTVAGYEGLYNFYNIGATSDPDYMQVIKNGLQYAKDAKGGSQATKDKYLIPWINPEKAISGGALFLGSSYISVGQNTLYLQKFDVNDDKPGELFWHQYMTNVLAPYSESVSIYNAYNNNGMLNTGMSFIIPVYNNMPAVPTSSPNINLGDFLADNTKVYADVTGTLNVRNGPGTNYEVLTQVTRTEVLTRTAKYIGSGEQWDKITLSNGISGYVFQSYIKEVPIVEQPEEPEITDVRVAELSIDKETILIVKNTTAKITATVLPENAINKTVSYYSKDPLVATIDENGIITGIDMGNTTIRVTTEDGNIEKTCDVAITELNEGEEIIISSELKQNQDEISGINTDVAGIKAKITTNLIPVFMNNKAQELSDQDLVGTGSKILFKNSENVIVSEYNIIVYGDLNGDGIVNALDVLLIQRHILETTPLKGLFLKAGNISKNGSLPSALDVLKMQRHILETALIVQ